MPHVPRTARFDPPRLPGGRGIRARLVVDRDHYDLLVREAIERAEVSVWIATANVKGMMVEAPIGTVARARGRYLSMLDTFDSLAKRGVELRMLYATTPSRPFRAELAKHAGLRLERRQCPRVHLKMIAVDGRLLYLGSANFTGAGLGAKGDGRRNFEMGILTDDDVTLDAAQARFERIWSGKECGACKLRGVCPSPLDQVRARVAAAKPTATKASPPKASSPTAGSKKKTNAASKTRKRRSGR